MLCTVCSAYPKERELEKNDSPINSVGAPLSSRFITTVAFVLILSFMAYKTITGVGKDIKLLALINSYPVALEVGLSSFPLILWLPTILTFIWAGIKRLRNTYTDENSTLLVKVAVISCPFLVLGVLLDKWYISNYMEERGYNYCYSYTGPSIYAKKVWTRGEEYCLKEASVVSHDLVSWAEGQAELGNEVSPEQFRLKVNQLLENPPLNR